MIHNSISQAHGLIIENSFKNATATCQCSSRIMNDLNTFTTILALLLKTHFVLMMKHINLSCSEVNCFEANDYKIQSFEKVLGNGFNKIRDNESLVTIENCSDVELDLVAPPHLIIVHLHLVNLTNVRLGRLTDLENIQNIAIFKSVIVGDVNILSANTNMFLENTVFLGKLEYYGYSRCCQENSLNVR